MFLNQITPLQLTLFLLYVITPAHQQTIWDGVMKLLHEGGEQVSKEPDDLPPQKMYKEYDFIVVGAGSAGCVVANRLSENPDWTVLLIEAGRPENYLMDFPILANYLQFTESNWGYKTQPSEKACNGLDGNQCNWPRGKVVGGSSVLNYMIYTRGNHRDYDHWAQMGNTGWSFKEVLPYFKKIENFSVEGVPYDPEYHGYDGYLDIEYSPYHTPIAEAVVNASMSYGFPYVDYNGRQQVGVSYLQLSQKDGIRESASRAYLHPVKRRRNLHMTKRSMVKRIVIDPISKEVKGVEMVKAGETYFIRARKEVISSAGAINSPQLLMLSGIGPRKHLKQVGIPMISDLKVGYNLMDHIATGGLTFMINETISLRTERIINNENLRAYLNDHKGPLAIPGGCEALVFTDFDHPNNPDGYPDMELLFIGGSIISDSILRKDFGIRDDIFDAIFKPIQKADTFMVFPMLMRPKSKGRILLKDANYKSHPLIFPNYFADPKDMETIIKGIRLTINITKEKALQKLGAKLHSIPIPQCKHLPFASDAYFDCMTRAFTFTIYHQSGTCKMGPKSDKKSVVDPRLRVYGVKGLRVMDASVIPEIPAAHTNAPTFLVAEKGSDMIKEDWGYLKTNEIYKRHI